jgi:hypothetical protein
VSGVTITTPDATVVGSPFSFGLLNSSNGSITLDGNGSQTVNGSASITVPPGDGYMVFTDGTNWFVIGRKTGVLPRGYIDGCVISNGTDATNDINIAAGVCRDSTNAVDIAVAAMSGKQLDANWAAGAAAGMRNSAAGIADGTYHIYAVTKADGTQDIYAYAGVAGTDPDSSASISTVLTALQAEPGGSGYIYARRIASIKRESSAIIAFSQRGNTFLRKVVARDATDTAATASSSLLPLSVPVGPQFDVLFSAGLRTNSAVLFLSSPDETDQAASSTGALSYRNLPDSSGETAVISPHYPLRTDRSAQIRVMASGAVTFDLATRGWIDSRGRDA